jgi:hypothetical protein
LKLFCNLAPRLSPRPFEVSDESLALLRGIEQVMDDPLPYSLSEFLSDERTIWDSLRARIHHWTELVVIKVEMAVVCLVLNFRFDLRDQGSLSLQLQRKLPL